MANWVCLAKPHPLFSSTGSWIFQMASWMFQGSLYSLYGSRRFYWKGRLHKKVKPTVKVSCLYNVLMSCYICNIQRISIRPNSQGMHCTAVTVNTSTSTAMPLSTSAAHSSLDRTQLASHSTSHLGYPKTSANPNIFSSNKWLSTALVCVLSGLSIVSVPDPKPTPVQIYSVYWKRYTRRMRSGDETTLSTTCSMIKRSGIS